MGGRQPLYVQQQQQTSSSSQAGYLQLRKSTAAAAAAAAKAFLKYSGNSTNIIGGNNISNVKGLPQQQQQQTVSVPISFSNTKNVSVPMEMGQSWSSGVNRHGGTAAAGAKLSLQDSYGTSPMTMPIVTAGNPNYISLGTSVSSTSANLINESAKRNAVVGRGGDNISIVITPAAPSSNHTHAGNNSSCCSCSSCSSSSSSSKNSSQNPLITSDDDVVDDD